MNWMNFFASLVFSLSTSLSAEVFDKGELKDRIEQEGVVFEFHGRQSATGLAVVTWRDPQNFFSYEHFALVTREPQHKTLVNALDRHHRVWVRGSVMGGGEEGNQDRSLRHIRIFEIEVREAHPTPYPDYDLPPEVMEKVKTSSELIGKVHAVMGEGRGFVLDYMGALFPVFVGDVPDRHKSTSLVFRTLSRGDKVRLYHKVQRRPRSPLHLNPNWEVEAPLEILDSVALQHGWGVRISGELVMFEPSIQVSRTVFAVRLDLGDGVHREYTIVNFTDPVADKEIQEGLKIAWEQYAQYKVGARGKWLNPRVLIAVEGKINFVDANQANPQVIVPSGLHIVVQFQ